METLVKMTRPAIHLPKPIFHVLGACPSTGKAAEREEDSTFSIPDGQAVWWKCSACHGWHASIFTEETNNIL